MTFLLPSKNPAFQDRWYLLEAGDAFYRYFTENPTGNPLLVLPTGTGKSVLIAKLVEAILHYYGSHTNILVLTHVKELIKQNYEKAVEVLGSDRSVGVFSSGLRRRDYHKQVTFAGIGTIYKRALLFKKTNLIFVDEAHLVGPGEATKYQQFFDDLRKFNPKLRVIGLTATDYRTGQGDLAAEGNLFTDVAYDLSEPALFKRLFDEGYLCRLVPKRTEQAMDLVGITTTAGDYNNKQLNERFGADAAACSKALEETLRLAKGRKKILVFAASIDHVNLVTYLLRQMGEKVSFVHSKDSNGRDQAIDEFKAGKVRWLVNKDILTTGFDDPGIDCIVMLRPTKSTNLWVQMLGRGIRPLYADGFDLNLIEGRLQAMLASYKQNCLVLDFARNTYELGPIDSPRRPGKKKKGKPRLKDCPACGAINGFFAETCENCAHEFPPLPVRGERGYVDLDDEASELNLISTDEAEQPQGPNWEVHDHIRVGEPSVSMYIKPGCVIPTLKLEFWGHVGGKNTPLRVFLPLATSGNNDNAWRAARDRWIKMGGHAPAPLSVEEGVARSNELKRIRSVRLEKMNPPYFEITKFYLEE